MANNSTSLADSSSSHPLCFLSLPTFDPNKNRPDSVEPTWIFLVTVNSIAIPPTVILNALIIWSVLGDEQLRSSTFNILLAFLAVTDILVGLLVGPMYCVMVGCFLGDCYSPCQFTAYALFLTACSGTTTVTLALASIERYLAIEHPNFYLKHITVKKFMIGSIMSVTATMAYTVIGTTTMIKKFPDLTKVPLMTVAASCGVVILYSSVKVQLTAYRQRRTIALQQESIQQPETHSLDEQQQQLNRLKEYKRVFMMTMLLGVSVVFYAPFVVFAVIEAVAGIDVTSDFKYLSGPVSALFLHLQSLINPIMMTLQLSYIRQGIKNKLTCFTGN